MLVVRQHFGVDAVAAQRRFDGQPQIFDQYAARLARALLAARRMRSARNG